jgi:hypothetical protein
MLVQPYAKSLPQRLQWGYRHSATRIWPLPTLLGCLGGSESLDFKIKKLNSVKAKRHLGASPKCEETTFAAGKPITMAITIH